MKIFVRLNISKLKVGVSGHTSDFESRLLRIGFLLQILLDLIVIFFGIIENILCIAHSLFRIFLNLFYFTQNWFSLLDYWILFVIIRELGSKIFHGKVGFWLNANLGFSLQQIHFSKQIEGFCLSILIPIIACSLNIRSNILDII